MEMNYFRDTTLFVYSISVTIFLFCVIVNYYEYKNVKDKPSEIVENSL